jgi:hypothetical protein
MQDKKIEAHERMIAGNGSVTLIVSFYSACGRRFRSQYSRTFPDSPEIEKLIAPRPLGNGGPSNSANTPPPWRSDVFMNKVVYDYSLVSSNGRDDSAEGSPSEHN